MALFRKSDLNNIRMAKPKKHIEAVQLGLFESIGNDRRKYSTPLMIDLFAGVGGIRVGFEREITGEVTKRK